MTTTPAVLDSSVERPQLSLFLLLCFVFGIWCEWWCRKNASPWLYVEWMDLTWSQQVRTLIQICGMKWKCEAPRFCYRSARGLGGRCFPWKVWEWRIGRSGSDRCFIRCQQSCLHVSIIFHCVVRSTCRLWAVVVAPLWVWSCSGALEVCGAGKSGRGFMSWQPRTGG